MSEKLQTLRGSMGAERWELIAQMSGTTCAYLNQIALGFRRPSVALAERIELAVKEAGLLPLISKEELVFTELRKNVRASKQSDATT